MSEVVPFRVKPPARFRRLTCACGFSELLIGDQGHPDGAWFEVLRKAKTHKPTSRCTRTDIVELTGAQAAADVRARVAERKAAANAR